MFKADVRSYEALVHTLDFRVAGTLHLAPQVRTLQALNAGGRPHLPITDCTVGSAGAVAREIAPADEVYRASYVALPKDRILWLVGGEGEPPQPGVEREVRQVVVLFPDHVLEGSIELPPGMRFRDFVATRVASRPFFELSEVEARSHGGRGSASFPFAAVNFRLAGALHDVAESREAPALFED